MEYIGLAPYHGKAVFVVSTADVAELPGELKLPCARFGLLLGHDATVKAERLSETLGKLLDVGCVFLCTWGPGCEHVHDLMDDVHLMRDLDHRVDGVILTTWHDKEPLDDALDLALMLSPDDDYAEGWDAIVVANIADAAEPDELRRLIFERLNPGQ